MHFFWLRFETFVACPISLLVSSNACIRVFFKTFPLVFMSTYNNIIFSINFYSFKSWVLLNQLKIISRLQRLPSLFLENSFFMNCPWIISVDVKFVRKRALLTGFYQISFETVPINVGISHPIFATANRPFGFTCKLNL